VEYGHNSHCRNAPDTLDQFQLKIAVDYQEAIAARHLHCEYDLMCWRHPFARDPL
jgi:hypothetical protein